MYYPYLRARQFELISLRELLADGIIDANVTAILEPVKDSFNNLSLAHRTFAEKGYRPYLIVNPIVGEFSGDNNLILNYLTSLDDLHFLPAFHYKQNPDFINQCVNDYNIQHCMLICYENFIDDESFRELCRQDFVTHITLLEPNKYRTLDRFLKSLGKNYIRLDDVFEKQLKNADFLDIAAHKLSEEHLYYREENFQGFSDFSVLPSEFVDGGSTPRAVVIHLSYLNQNENNEIWIRHFTSNTNDSIANVQGKFAEAAEKAVAFCNQNNLNNSAIAELRNYYYEGRYPGLGIVKKISIKNHLSIVMNFLNTQNG